MSLPLSNSASSIFRRSSARTGPSFPFGNRLARVFWHCAYLALFRISPRPFHSWRAFLLRCFGARIGRNCHIYPKAEIWAPWNLQCGDETGVADRAILYNQAVITLGDRVVISQGAHLCTGTHDYNSPDFPLMTYPITVRSQVWICAEAFIHPGITIEAGAVIGARSVVTRNIPAWTVAAGNPCAPIKPRELRLKSDKS
jgi:putative colanic acid biosynthesis acetyltransferase WcaF